MTDKDDVSDLAASIEYWRNVRGLSQNALSAKAGLAASAVNDIHKNPDRSPRLSTVEALAAALDVSLWQLLKGPREKAAVSDHGGLDLVAFPDIAPDLKELLGRLAERDGIPTDARTFLGVVRDWSASFSGFLPNVPFFVAPATEYSGEVVAVTKADADGRPQGAKLKYCAPPWLISIEGFGRISHEFMEAPSIRIIGVAREIEIDFRNGPGARPKKLDSDDGENKLIHRSN